MILDEAVAAVEAILDSAQPHDRRRQLEEPLLLQSVDHAMVSRTMASMGASESISLPRCPVRMASVSQARILA